MGEKMYRIGQRVGGSLDHTTRLPQQAERMFGAMVSSRSCAVTLVRPAVFAASARGAEAPLQ